MIFNILPDNFINLPNLPYFILNRFYFCLHVEGPPGEGEPVLSGSREFPAKGLLPRSPPSLANLPYGCLPAQSSGSGLWSIPSGVVSSASIKSLTVKLFGSGSAYAGPPMPDNESML